jgi:hypothetical protein
MIDIYEHKYQIMKAFVIWYIVYYIIKNLALYFQNQLVYVPAAPSEEYRYPDQNPKGLRSPSEFKLPFVDISVKTSDGYSLKGWFITQPTPKSAVTLIFFQGNGGNIGNRLMNLCELYKNLKCNIVIVGYRGYGYSEGKPTEQGLQTDSLAVLDWVLKEESIDNSKVFVFGRSLGGAVAVYL